MVTSVIEQSPPGVALAADLSDCPLPLLDDLDLLDVLGAWERVRSWAEAKQNDVLVELGHRFDAMGATTGWEARSNAEELGLALGAGASSAASRQQQAETLAERLPLTRAALASGAISGHHARLITQATRRLDPGTARAVDAAVAADAATGGWGTPRQAETSARMHAAALDPAGAGERHRRAAADRNVTSRPADDGMATIWALLPAADAQTFMAAIEAMARASATRPGPLDTRTLAQRRADAMVSLAVDALAAPDAPTIHGRRPTVNVTVSWSTLIGCNDAPADLSGYGPIDAETARRIAADPSATWRRLLTDPVSGRLIDLGRSTYRPPADLAAFVVARDGTCRGPSCHHRADLCDVDHRQRWDDGGPTAEANLDPLCRPVHRMKDEGGWSHERDPVTGESVWTSPKGRTVRRPGQHLPRNSATEPPPDSSADPP